MNRDEAAARLLRLAMQGSDTFMFFGTAEADACRLAASDLSKTFDAYEDAVMPLAFYPGRGTGNMSYPAHGLAGETGEALEKSVDTCAEPCAIRASIAAARVNEHAKKAMRDHGGAISPERREAILNELGDVLWYVAATASELGSSLAEVADMNKNKLLDRHARGVLGGSGDTR